MTTLTSTKLTDTRLIALSGATQRQDGAVSLPDRIKGMATQKLATSLMDKGFVREIRAKPSMPAWRRDKDGRTTVSSSFAVLQRVTKKLPEPTSQCYASQPQGSG
jgi:hypothetical protein